MNRQYLQRIVRGKYGRKIAYVDDDYVDENNIVRIIGDTIHVFNYNKPIIKYLHDYYKGDQPILYRPKKGSRDDIKNAVVVNRAYEIVAFKNAQTNGEPIQCVSLVKDDSINRSIDRFNDYCRAAHKQAKDITCGEWTSATGTGFKAVQRINGGLVPFRIVTPTPLNTYIVYSKTTEEPLLAVQEMKTADKKLYYHCFSETHEYIVQNSKIVPFKTQNGNYISSKIHAFGGIPIIEYPNNSDRLSDIELVVDILDAINETQTSRIDAIQQFVQSWIKFVNCEIDEKTFSKMKMMGALVVKSNNGSEGKADVDVMSQELNQTQTQVYKDDLWDDALSILGIPSKESSSSGGDRAGATYLKNGWDFSKQRAQLKDPLIKQSEKRLSKIILNIIRLEKGANECQFNEMQYDVQISHSPTDNMQSKAQVLQMLLNAGIHPLIAIKVCGLWADAEKTYLLSKPFLDVIYKTTDEIENAKEQTEKANMIVKKYNEQNLNVGAD